jgi:hypothetical protein
LDIVTSTPGSKMWPTEGEGGGARAFSARTGLLRGPDEWMILDSQ